MKFLGVIKMAKHKWAEVIKAWAEGREIQYSTDNGINWFNMTGNLTPEFSFDNTVWRIKPESETITYRLGLFKTIDNRYKVMVSHGPVDDMTLAASLTFVRWISETETVVI